MDTTYEITMQGAPLYVETRGEGTPVVLLHSGVADRRMWDAQWETLSDRFRLIRFDMRGWGRSTAPDGAFAYHQDVRGILDHFGIETAHVAGVSFGGRVALDFALAYPDRVRSLLLGAAGIGGVQPSDEMKAFGAQEDALVEAGDLDAAAQLNVDFWVVGPKRAPEQVDESVRKAIFEMQRTAFDVPLPTGFQPIALEPPANTRLHEVRAPTLVLVGDADIDHMLHLSRRAAAEIPGARLLVRPSVGHMVTMERPHEIEPLLREFWGD